MEAEKDWQAIAETLLKQGKNDDARRLLESVSAHGGAIAHLMLARTLWRMNQYDEAARVLDLCEQEVKEDDAAGHMGLHVAYSIGIGPGDRSERLKRAFVHLKQVAIINGRPEDVIAVAVHYRDGLNEVDRDLSEARRWLVLAADQGNSEAATLLKKLDRRMQQEPPRR